MRPKMGAVEGLRGLFMDSSAFQSYPGHVRNTVIYLTSKLCVVYKFGKLTLNPTVQIINVNNE